MGATTYRSCRPYELENIFGSSRNIIGSFLEWIEVEVVHSNEAKATTKVFRRLLSTHGIPRVIVSDNGSGFLSEEYKKFLYSNRIKPPHSAPYDPASNGQAERMVQTFKNSIKNFQGNDIETQLCRFTVHSYVE
nr:uncharacterized protein K02A2.6-like [Hydra vulgaris]